MNKNACVVIGSLIGIALVNALTSRSREQAAKEEAELLERTNAMTDSWITEALNAKPLRTEEEFTPFDVKIDDLLKKPLKDWTEEDKARWEQWMTS